MRRCASVFDIRFQDRYREHTAEEARMIVCLCEGISEREIRDAARRGAATLPAIQRACGAGGDCGACRPQVRKIAREVRSTQRQSND